jgi:CRP-like cAMP-binding protein
MVTEGCLLRDVRRTADVKADDYCYVWVLDREDFRAILLRYPTVGQDMELLDKDWLDDIALSRASSAADVITDDSSSSIDDDNTSYADAQ